ncbi:zinc finger protein Paris-like [Chironomus tepperi]|uniref:zinc finger protein Paris-like n=1 Tax=Chironomus tepperi TaxID=113505 RepID=UPI00391F44C5
MDGFDETDVMLEDHINKCRCCFRMLIDDQKSIRISKSIEQKFFELTQIELIDAEIFSSKICQLCHNDLEVFHNFRKDLVQKQRKLYSAIVQSTDQILKSEDTNEFIECSGGTEDEEYLGTEFQIKTEASDNLGMCVENYIEDDEKMLSNYTKKSLKSNMDRVHIGEEIYTCDRCNNKSQSKVDLEDHMKSHISKQTRTYFCEICGLDFDKRHLLNRHVKIKHTVKERRHKCSHQNCDKAFFTVSALKKHVESHSEKEMPCEYCGKLFSCLNNLRTHLYYHSEPKFVCEFEGCGKKFFMRKLLKAHINVHRGQKDYECEYCEKSYFFQAHLKRHVLSMHMRLKIDCELCSSTFARKETYRNHVINQHQNLSSEALEKLLTKIRNMKVEDYRSTSTT